MKEWFKHKYGFVNIDSDNLYLTNTGNWPETAQLSEKSKKGQYKKGLRRKRIQIYFILCIIIFSIILLRMILEGKIRIVPTALIVIGTYYLYHYLRTEMGPSFRIPLNKINQIEIINRDVKIHFVDQESKADLVSLTNIEEKGVKLLTKFKETNC